MNQEQKKQLQNLIKAYIDRPIMLHEKGSSRKISREIVEVIEKYMKEKQLCFAI